ncbi:flagellar assembly factor FliW [Tindallia magadiensis]|uniref:Flagellar assembly factor FliW n=1 Tax=Tindallia magadiensis TaxID=69895 RepID=A0A1I3C6G4_9FIRM|nr:flagellar assembly protein FliW [Tindallia magadiensis]SFH70144.1 flagellar assembly factor FliW [Tindallia magadiensis]
MQLETKNFGMLEIEEDNIIYFPEGIPGFENLKRYVFIQNPEENVPFHWIQSVDDGELAFVVVNPFLCRFDYEFELPQSVIDKLEIEAPEDLKFFSIVKIPEKIEEMTINLLAPIVINEKNNKAQQVVLNENQYHTRHRVMDEFKRNETLSAEEGK